jgi:hypothetical protein
LIACTLISGDVYAADEEELLDRTKFEGSLDPLPLFRAPGREVEGDEEMSTR